MKSVSYTSSCYLSCAQCAGEVIICVDAALTDSGKPYIEGVAASVECQTDSCGRTSYVYAFTYEESQLADPNTDLLESDIGGVLCKGCLTDYINGLIDFSLLPIYADNAAALLGGLIAGDLYRTGSDPDVVCVVH